MANSKFVEDIRIGGRKVGNRVFAQNQSFKHRLALCVTN